MEQFLAQNIIDLSKITDVISPEQPAGYDARNHVDCQNQYYDLHDMRQDFRRAERLGEDIDVEIVLLIIKKSYTLLTNYTKDIEVYCWFIEALTYLYGFSGLHDSVKGLNALIEQYGDTLYPLFDEEFPEKKVMPILTLDGGERAGTLEKCLNLSPLFIADNQVVSLWHWQKEAMLSHDRVARIAKQLPANEKKNHQLILTNALAEITLLEDHLRILHTHNLLGLSSIKRILKEGITLLTKLFPAEIERKQIVAPSNDQRNDSIVENKEASESLIKETNDYQQILAHFSTVTAYFKENQPHSLITYSLLRTERWLGMSLADVMNEMIMHDEIKLDLQRCFGLALLNKPNYAEESEDEDEDEDD